MKQPNKQIVRAVAGLVATGTVVPSCVSDFLYTNEHVKLSENGLSAVNINLAKEDTDYLRFLDKLGKDIINNPAIAQEFAKNPQLFVEKYGYQEKIDIEENLMKLILTFGDEDINTAVKDGDIKLTLSLMKDKGLLNDDSYTKITLSEEQQKDILALLGIDEADFDQYGACTLAFVCIVAVVVGVTTLAVALYYVTAAAAAAAAVLAYLEIEASGYCHINNSSFLDSNTPLKIWGLRGNAKNTCVAVDIYAEEKVNQIIEAMEDMDANVFKKDMSKEQFKQILKLNILDN
jgi:hypothetical protein